MLLTGTLFVLCNAAFAFYLIAVVPTLDYHQPGLVSAIALVECAGTRASLRAEGAYARADGSPSRTIS